MKSVDEEKEQACILLVDDEPDSLALLKILLENANHQILTANDGLEAIEVAKKSSPDLVIMDVQMPELDGLAACLQLKKLFKDFYLPVILVTALGEPMDKVNGITAGADDYIVKPYFSDEVIAKVNRFLQLKKRFDNIQDQLEEATENEKRLTKRLYEISE